MFNIARTQELRLKAVGLLEGHERALAANPDSFAYQMMAISARSRVEELTQRLIEEKRDREIELVEIRLIGESAQNGTLPLHMLGQLSTSFEETLIEIGKYAKHGSKKRKNSFVDTRHQLNPQLKRMGVGSTKLFVSINNNPDIFGNSLSEVCISRTFEILSTDSSDSLLEASSIVGKNALRNLNRFLKALLEFNLEVNINWYTPLDTELSWRGDKFNLKKLQASLADITQTEPLELDIEGELVTQSLKGNGRFELINNNGVTISGSVPTDVLATFVQVRIGSYCKVKVLQTTHENPATGNSKNFYELRAIEVVPKSVSTSDDQQEINMVLNELASLPPS